MNKKNFFDRTFLTNSFEETRKLGKDFAETLKKGDAICLYGDLGSGKTTFIQGMAKGLGIKNRIISPTFVIVRCYKLQNQESSERFYHMDLYRIGSEKDIEGLGIGEIINDKNNIVAVEWADKLGNQKLQKKINIEFSYESDNVRRIVFRSSNQQ
jgi:tRNA threonylcarbamoyladenosine biosynthesis protein TsaE